eukprot:TRINITY_DN11238_c0_g1_i9.p3 TRINITY_DN11238_c0_g1~~TRINITY_DN11238_c0_g1_i9.p3  ORF type:complete len:112 (-),score=10.69 TRINITY_DN11238_c0_g1_i9:215-550(-)
MSPGAARKLALPPDALLPLSTITVLAALYAGTGGRAPLQTSRASAGRLAFPLDALLPAATITILAALYAGTGGSAPLQTSRAERRKACTLPGRTSSRCRNHNPCSKLRRDR